VPNVPQASVDVASSEFIERGPALQPLQLAFHIPELQRQFLVFLSPNQGPTSRLEW
jgi:hypothetical protein